ncbi:unnamed protein product (macronuclear) [Paramecium tetraurelia]|uniref:Transmembrane protein n=1 Tax=Paramecium tetraurelia TaxID=5888 RepID=A0CJ93_PARTE|nr:uncharacterized protein GSPATT00000569001 [Paramecium tetraurelia]CAK70860.1 unnamed protein product [Paramecium tetraurelia]|eukprot:XP_001438257.1 hypothetical protein (macronuclear) [Paramecium tetraurelia strain d4-2]
MQLDLLKTIYLQHLMRFQKLYNQNKKHDSATKYFKVQHKLVKIKQIQEVMHLYKSRINVNSKLIMNCTKSNRNFHCCFTTCDKEVSSNQYRFFIQKILKLQMFLQNQILIWLNEPINEAALTWCLIHILEATFHFILQIQVALYFIMQFCSTTRYMLKHKSGYYLIYKQLNTETSIFLSIQFYCMKLFLYYKIFEQIFVYISGSPFRLIQEQWSNIRLSQQLHKWQMQKCIQICLQLEQANKKVLLFEKLCKCCPFYWQHSQKFVNTSSTRRLYAYYVKAHNVFIYASSNEAVLLLRSSPSQVVVIIISQRIYEKQRILCRKLFNMVLYCIHDMQTSPFKTVPSITVATKSLSQNHLERYQSFNHNLKCSHMQILYFIGQTTVLRWLVSRNSTAKLNLYYRDQIGTTIPTCVLVSQVFL